MKTSKIVKYLEHSPLPSCLLHPHHSCLRCLRFAFVTIRTHLTSCLSQHVESQVRDLENRLSRAESELAVSNATLVERTSQLSTIQKELEQRRASQSTLEENLKKEQVLVQ